MTNPSFHIIQCNNNDCRFRFPKLSSSSNVIPCPKCGSVTSIMITSFSNQKTAHECHPKPYPKVSILLDNIRSIYNVGSMMRTGDGAGVKHFYLTGITATPEHKKLNKTGLGAELQTSWSYHPNGLDIAEELKNEGCAIWSSESSPSSVSILMLNTEQLDQKHIVLVFGNENSGVDPGILKISDMIVSIPMQGYKDSLNVATAFGIAVYAIRYLL